MNIAVLIGRLTKDPELRYIASSGKAVARFSIAVDRTYTSRSGEKQTDFFNIVVWGKSAENCAQYLAKGRLVAVKGSIENRSYENQNGEKKYITEIIAENVQFLEWGDKKTKYDDNATFQPSKPVEDPSEYQPKGLDENGYRELDDDDVPF